MICGPNPIRFPREKRLVRWLRGLASRDVALGGIDTGSYLLARAGLLDGYHCTIHWQDMETLLLDFPDIIVSSHLFEIDRNRYTCSGGTAPMDMMLNLIARLDGGGEIAGAAADLLIHDRMRPERDRQRIPLRQRLGTAQPRLAEAIVIMEANLEEPLRLGEIAHHMALSPRQIERLFRNKLACTPGQYYMELRLNRARQRLLHTDESVTAVAQSLGFRSVSHFSRRYSAFFGVTPSDERRRAAP
jgi:transcriptional regulator GlxA family with amidase domain